VHPLVVRDVEWYRESVLPGLGGIPLSVIAMACGVVKSTASTIRSGKRVPAERRWEALQSLFQLGPRRVDRVNQTL